MASWLTTHYPHPAPDNVRWDIYLQPEHKDAVRGIAIGDRVFFYEYKEQKPLKKSQKHPAGAQGIVRVAIVSGQVYRREDGETEYADETTKQWSWVVPTDNADTTGFVSRADLLRVIGYKSGSSLRGFNRGRGVRLLTDDEASELMDLFKAGSLAPRRDSLSCEADKPGRHRLSKEGS